MTGTKKGFYFRLSGKDVFVETVYQRKTESLLRKILKACELPDNPDTRAELSYFLKPAKCDLREDSIGRQYYEIYGKGWGGYGHFLDEDMDIIISI